MVQVEPSLVKYESPVMLSSAKEKSRKNNKKNVDTKKMIEGRDTEALLNSILPPREWVDNGQIWVQNVQSIPATRLDVITLQENLDRRLQEEQARETGICSIRAKLYSQVFDELIRQVTITCAERGLLLLRTRDEIRMNLHNLQTLYESSIAFGIRKALIAQQKKQKMENELRDLDGRKQELEDQLRELSEKCKNLEVSDEEAKEAETARHTEETEKLIKGNETLKGNLEALLSAPNS